MTDYRFHLVEDKIGTYAWVLEINDKPVVTIADADLPDRETR